MPTQNNIIHFTSHMRTIAVDVTLSPKATAMPAQITVRIGGANLHHVRVLV
jgi:hypothetical protein